MWVVDEGLSQLVLWWIEIERGFRSQKLYGLRKSLLQSLRRWQVLLDKHWFLDESIRLMLDTIGIVYGIWFSSIFHSASAAFTNHLFNVQRLLALRWTNNFSIDSQTDSISLKYTKAVVVSCSPSSQIRFTSCTHSQINQEYTPVHTNSIEKAKSLSDGPCASISVQSVQSAP